VQPVEELGDDVLVVAGLEVDVTETVFATELLFRLCGPGLTVQPLSGQQTISPS